MYSIPGISRAKEVSESPAGEIWFFLSWILLKISPIDEQSIFFSKITALFYNIQKRSGEKFPHTPPLVAPLI